MVTIETGYLKEKIEHKLQEGGQNRNRREDLYGLDQQIRGLHSTFALISSAQEQELRRCFGFSTSVHFRNHTRTASALFLKYWGKA